MTYPGPYPPPPNPTGTEPTAPAEENLAHFLHGFSGFEVSMDGCNRAAETIRRFYFPAPSAPPAQPEQPDGCHCAHEVGCPARTPHIHDRDCCYGPDDFAIRQAEDAQPEQPDGLREERALAQQVMANPPAEHDPNIDPEVLRMAAPPAQPEQPDGLREVASRLLEACDAADDAQYGTVATWFVRETLAAALAAQPDPTPLPDREALARIIDPDAWGNYGYDLNGYQRRRALGRADAVIAYLQGRQ